MILILEVYKIIPEETMFHQSTSDTVSFEKKISGFSSENVKNFRMEFEFFLFLPKSYN